MVAETLGLTEAEGEIRHTAGKWRCRIVKAVQGACDDPDTPLPGWLEVGSPMGIEEQIQPGGLFPRCDSPAEASSLEGLL